MRRFEVGASTDAPVRAAMSARRASASGLSSTEPPAKISAGSEPSSACTASPSAPSSSAVGAAGVGGGAIRPPSFQPRSAGAISTAPRPGEPVAAPSAAIASAAKVSGEVALRTQSAKGAAAPSMSAVSGASWARWLTAWSPTSVTIGVRAFLALWRLAAPLASPGARCSSDTAGLRAMRA